MVALTVVFLYVFKNNKLCCIYTLEVFCLTHTGKSPLVCSLLFVSISIHCFSPFKLITRYTRSTKMRNKNMGNMLLYISSSKYNEMKGLSYFEV